MLYLDFLFSFCFFWFPALILFLLTQSGYSFKVISIFNVFIFCFLTFSYVGIGILYFGLDPFRASANFSNKFVWIKLYLFTITSVVFLFVGKFFSPSISPLLDNENCERSGFDVRLTFIICIILFFCCFTIYKYITSVGSVALFIALGLVDGDSAVSRGEMTNAFVGYHYFKFLNQDLLSLISFIAVSQFVLHGRGFLVCLFAVVVTAFSFVLSTEKAPLMWVLIGFYLVALLSQGKRAISASKLIMPACILVAVSAASYLVFMGISVDRFDVALGSVFSRVFAGSVQPAYYYIQFFTDNDFLLGRSFPNPGGVLPFVNFNLTQVIYEYANPTAASAGIAGSMPVVFWGEAFANFGFFGVVVVSFLVGCFLGSVDRLFNLVNGDEITIALYVWSILHFKDFAVTGFSQYLADTYLIGIVVVVVIMKFILRVRVL